MAERARRKTLTQEQSPSLVEFFLFVNRPSGMACSGDSRLLSAICREFYRLPADFTSFFLFITSNHPESAHPGHVVQHGHHLPLSVDLLL
ncbi:hypothetical protein, partial [Geothermobacter hydrogeniphilus]|uniref:hypothetical protein n=1 Tax=Geothermobacter hydrogeniphilus TaxID=1969733 RepID=UPI001C0E6DB7